MFYGEVLQC